MAMKKYLSLALLLGYSIACHAEGLNTLVIELTNKTTAKYSLEEKPLISFAKEGGEKVLKVSGVAVAFTEQLSNVAKYYFESKATAIQNVKGDGDFRFAYDGESLSVDGVTAVSVFSLDGKQLKSIKGDGELNISLSDLPKGIYVVKASGKSIKIIK